MPEYTARDFAYGQTPLQKQGHTFGSSRNPCIHIVGGLFTRFRCESKSDVIGFKSFLAYLYLFGAIEMDLKNLFLTSGKHVQTHSLARGHLIVVEFAHIIERAQHVERGTGGLEFTVGHLLCLILLTLFPAHHFGSGGVAASRKYQMVMTEIAILMRWKSVRSDKTEEVTNRELEATGPTLDMLSAFYYMRKLDYDKMAPGETVRLNVFSGRQKEILKIHFDGTKEIKIGKKRFKTYHITFTFTSKAGKKTSDNMDAWISATPERVPLLLEGRLPVGKVRAVYSGKMPA